MDRQASEPSLRLPAAGRRPQTARSTPHQPENHMITCVRCDDTNGPFSRQPEGPVCEKCLEDQDGQS